MSIKKTIVAMSACFIVSFLIVTILYALSKKIVRGNFHRQFPPHILSARKTRPVKYNSYYISGISRDLIYLSNPTSPAHLMTLDIGLTRQKVSTLEFEDSIKKLSVTFHYIIDSPTLYLINGYAPVMYQGNVSGLTMAQVQLAAEKFDACIPLSANSSIIRTYDSVKKQNILLKTSSGEGNRRSYTLNKQIDGIFCVDGMLSYQYGTDRLYYTYFYQNQFACLDTNLNLLYTARTLDSNSRAKINVSKLEYTTHTNTMFGSPPLTVNRLSYANGAFLFINSALVAENEPGNILQHESVIDVFLQKNGEYRFSFYIPDNNDEKLKSFFVNGEKLIVLYDHFIDTYKIKL